MLSRTIARISLARKALLEAIFPAIADTRYLSGPGVMNLPQTEEHDLCMGIVAIGGQVACWLGTPVQF